MLQSGIRIIFAGSGTNPIYRYLWPVFFYKENHALLKCAALDKKDATLQSKVNKSHATVASRRCGMNKMCSNTI